MTPREALLVEVLDTRDEAKVVSMETADRLLQVPLNPKFLDWVVMVSSELTPEESAELQETLRCNADVFAWSAKDMPGVNPEVITHRLNVDPTYRPVKQKRRNFALDRS